MTTSDVRRTIRAIYNKQSDTHPPIGIDTLLLILRVDAKVLLPLINELQLNGDISCHASKSSLVRRGAIKYGTVTLNNPITEN